MAADVQWDDKRVSSQAFDCSAQNAAQWVKQRAGPARCWFSAIPVPTLIKTALVPFAFFLD